MTSSFNIKPNEELSFSQGNQEIEIPRNTKIYQNKEEVLIIRFDNAYFLFLEQEIRDPYFMEPNI